MIFSLRELMPTIMSSFMRSSGNSPSPPSKSSSSKPKKVHWGTVVTIRYSPSSKQRSLHPISDVPSSCRKSIIKSPTPLDLEMMHKNLWNMVLIADGRLALHHQFLTTYDDKLLEKILRYEDRLVREISNARVREEARRTGTKLRFRVRRPGKRGKRLKRKKWQ